MSFDPTCSAQLAVPAAAAELVSEGRVLGVVRVPGLIIGLLLIGSSYGEDQTPH